jgi:hypothetical protein
MDTSQRLDPNTNKSEDSSNSETPVPPVYIHLFLLHLLTDRSLTMFLLKDSDYLKLFRRDNLLDLKELICNWRNAQIKSLQSKISLNYHFLLCQRSLTIIFAKHSFDQETPSDTQGMRLKIFNTTQEMLDKVDMIIWFVLCSCLSNECYWSCLDFVILLRSSQKQVV